MRAQRPAVDRDGDVREAAGEIRDPAVPVRCPDGPHRRSARPGLARRQSLEIRRRPCTGRAAEARPFRRSVRSWIGARPRRRPAMPRRSPAPHRGGGRPRPAPAPDSRVTATTRAPWNTRTPQRAACASKRSSSVRRGRSQPARPSNGSVTASPVGATRCMPCTARARKRRLHRAPRAGRAPRHTRDSGNPRTACAGKRRVLEQRDPHAAARERRRGRAAGGAAATTITSGAGSQPSAPAPRETAAAGRRAGRARGSRPRAAGTRRWCTRAAPTAGRRGESCGSG